MTFEYAVDTDCAEVDSDVSGRPCLSSIAKDAVFLDKELAASGFTRKDQEDIEKVWWCNIFIILSANDANSFY